MRKICIDWLVAACAVICVLVTCALIDDGSDEAPQTTVQLESE